MSNLFHTFLVLVAAFEIVYSNCNYVHNHESNTVYATDVCMHMSETSHFYSKFICESESDSQLYPYVKTYSNSNCSNSNLAASFRMDDEIMGNVSFSYNCSANYTGCYVEYVDGCFNTSDDKQISIFSPINTCIKDESGSYAFEFECDINGMIYKEYTSMSCDSRKLRLTKNIFDCTLISADESFTGKDRYFEVSTSVFCLVFLFFYCSC